MTKTTIHNGNKNGEIINIKAARSLKKKFESANKPKIVIQRKNKTLGKLVLFI